MGLRQDCRGDLGFNQRSAACVHKQPDAQALHVNIELRPSNVGWGQAHIVPIVRPGDCGHHQGRILYATRHGAGDAPDIRRVYRHPAKAWLQRKNTAPACWQAHRASNVCSEMERAIASRGRRGGPRTRSARRT